MSNEVKISNTEELKQWISHAKEVIDEIENYVYNEVQD